MSANCEKEKGNKGYAKKDVSCSYPILEERENIYFTIAFVLLIVQHITYFAEFSKNVR